MELKDCIVTRIYQACDAKKIPHRERYKALVEAFANDHYRRMVQSTLATYHVTNAKDLIPGVFL